MQFTWPNSTGFRVFTALSLVGTLSCGGVIADGEASDTRTQPGSEQNTAGQNSADSRSTGSNSGSADLPFGSVSSGSCEPSWKSIGLNGLPQRRQWTEPVLRVDCETREEILTTDSEQNGFPMRLTFTFRDGELIGATHTLTAPAFEYESELSVDRIQFEDLERGRRRIEFEGSILPPEGDPIEARGVGNACQETTRC